MEFFLVSFFFVYLENQKQQLVEREIAQAFCMRQERRYEETMDKKESETKRVTNSIALSDCVLDFLYTNPQYAMNS